MSRVCGLRGIMSHCRHQQCCKDLLRQVCLRQIEQPSVASLHPTRRSNISLTSAPQDLVQKRYPTGPPTSHQSERFNAQFQGTCGVSCYSSCVSCPLFREESRLEMKADREAASPLLARCQELLFPLVANHNPPIVSPLWAVAPSLAHP